MLPPFASVVGGTTMVYLVVREPTVLVVDDYARIEEITRERFARDGRAADLELTAELTFTARAGTSAAGPSLTLTTIELALTGSDALVRPTSLALRLQHAGGYGGDRHVLLEAHGGRYGGSAALAAGRYDVELAPADGSWRLGGSLSRVPGRLYLAAQHPEG
jgi:hypothetical protein